MFYFDVMSKSTSIQPRTDLPEFGLPTPDPSPLGVKKTTMDSGQILPGSQALPNFVDLPDEHRDLPTRQPLGERSVGTEKGKCLFFRIRGLSQSPKA